MDTTLAPTLLDRSLPRLNRRVRDILLIVGGSLCVAGMAQVRIPLPFTPVPITGQTFAVLLVGAVLGSRRGAASLQNSFYYTRRIHLTISESLYPFERFLGWD